MSPGQLVRPGQCRPPRGPTVGLEVVPLPLDLTPSGTTSIQFAPCGPQRGLMRPAS